MLVLWKQQFASLDLLDHPWVENAKRHPTCEFLSQKKQPEFAHMILSLYPNLPQPQQIGSYIRHYTVLNRPPSSLPAVSNGNTFHNYHQITVQYSSYYEDSISDFDFFSSLESF